MLYVLLYKNDTRCINIKDCLQLSGYRNYINNEQRSSRRTCCIQSNPASQTDASFVKQTCAHGRILKYMYMRKVNFIYVCV